MAECSYTRCLQERRFIKRELLRWSKDMVNIVGLERVAEELMGRRKWKLFQESLTRTHLNANITNLEQNEISNQNKELDQKNEKETLIGSAVEENHILDIDETTSIIKRELTKTSDDEKSTVVVIKREDTEEKLIKENIKLNNCTSQTNNNNKGVDENANGSDNNNANCKPNGNGIIDTDSHQYPIDWKPNDKCYFCVDGKLLTVNEKGDLVAESGPALSEAELANRQPLDTDSDSSDSSPDSKINVNKAITSRLGDSLQQNMTSFESVAAQLAAIQSMQGFQPGLGQLYPGLWYQHQLAQQINSGTPTTSETSAPALSPSPKDSPSPTDATGEQPLDLSAKASPNSSAGGDHKSLLRAKPRMTAVTSRRTYTEEELHSALQDIITGKLGTRRAAVLYGIPRSTLRNKVYKIAMEQKRATPSSLHQQSLEDLVDGDDDDKELSGDEELTEKSSSLTTQSDEIAARFETSHSTASALQKITKTNDSSHTAEMKATTSLEGHSLQKQQNTTPHSHSQTPPIPPWNIDPNILLFLSNMGNAINSNMEHDPQMFRELIASIIMKSEEQKKASAEGRETSINNGKSNMIDPRLQQYQQQQQHQHQHSHQHKQHQHSSQHHSGHSFQNRLPKSETPETVSSVDLNDSSDDPSVILKIPSYKPVAGSSTSSNKNGEGLASPSSKMTSSMLAAAVSNQKLNNITEISPSSIRHSNDSQPSPNIFLKDVIANSISRTFSQQASREANAHKHNASSPVEPNDQYKRPSISVLKNIGGTDISRFASAPNLLGSNNINHHNSQNLANNAAGGKGTRPKRGKYRNYDRDSLVEAVKAVQRGEMSVHRAGSYYGVPHSTLEYKVKERHLMRPRKREPKPQPLDERTVGTSCVGGNNGTSSASSKNSNIPNLAAVNSLDKLKATSSSSQKQSGLKNNPPFPNISANGMKRPIFDQAMAAQLQYAANPLIFWQHSTSPAFTNLPIDFQRQQAAAAAAAAAAGNSTSFPDNLLTSQIMQRFQDETNRLTGGCNPSVTPATNNNKNNFNNNTQSSSHETSPSPSLTNKSSRNSLPTKTTPELAETLYDNGGANGSSFLDGIIRKTLDRKSTDRPHDIFMDQLIKNIKPPDNYNKHLSSNSVSGKTKRPASPGYSDIDIKRERSSPPTTDTSASSESEKNHPMSINDHLHHSHHHHHHHHRPHHQHHHNSRDDHSDNENDHDNDNDDDNENDSDSESFDKDDDHHNSHHHQHHHRNKIRRQLSVEELNGSGNGNGNGNGSGNDGNGSGVDGSIGGVGVVGGCGNANSLLNSISSNCGNNSILHDQLEQMKSSETEDSL